MMKYLRSTYSFIATVAFVSILLQGCTSRDISSRTLDRYRLDREEVSSAIRERRPEHRGANEVAVSASGAMAKGADAPIGVLRRLPASGRRPQKLLPANEMSGGNPAMMAYDSAMIGAVQKRWNSLAEQGKERIGDGSGLVTVNFRLYPDGRVSDLKSTGSSVNDFMQLMCENAILQSGPFPAWTEPMRTQLNTQFRRMKITFHYQ